jgi:membrane protein
MRSAAKRLADYFLKDLWTPGKGSRGKASAFGVALLRLIAVIVRDLFYGDLTLRAMSLVYTTLLSLVPLLAVSFSVLKAFGVHNKLEALLYNLLAPLGPKAAELAQRISEFVNNMKVGVLGFVGLGLLIYTVISLIQKIEESFNAIWRVRSLRSILQRFSDYLSVILIGPVLVVTALGLTATLLSTTLMQKITEFWPIGAIVTFAGRVVPYLLVCAAFTFVYLFVPNTKVKLTAAAVGGFVGGLLWETVGWGFASFIVTSTRYAAIYSGFAILILFMLWLYVSWLILLVGAEIAFYYQNPHLLTLGKPDRLTDALLIERTALSIMFLVADHFYRNLPPWTLNALVQRLGLIMEQVEDVLAALKKSRLIVESGDDPTAYLPARDLGTISLRDVYASVRGQSDDNRAIPEIGEVRDIIRDIDAIIGNRLGEKTLRDLVRSKEQNAG